MGEYSGKEASTARSSSDTDRLHRGENQFVPAYIAIKGTRNGLLLTLEPETPFEELLSALAERLSESPSFFRGASLTVDTTYRTLRKKEHMQLENLLAHYQMSILSIESPTEKRPAAKTIVLPPPNTEFPASMEEMMAKVNKVDSGHVQRDMQEFADTLFLRRTIRSGQAIHHRSNIVVLGDVNPGAEIVAGGDIIVWGALRGMVHAGYPDNENVSVCSLQLAPVQLRIAHLLSRPPEGFEAMPRPEVATIRNGQIVVETWIGGRPSRK
jgi:septum site-determining protein MinC